MLSHYYGAPIAPWGKRVLAHLVDAIPGIVVYIFSSVGSITLISAVGGGSREDELSIPILIGFFLFFGLLWVACVIFGIWNIFVRQSQTGQSLGKRAMGIRLVSEATGCPLSWTDILVRQFAHILDGFAYVGYFLPLFTEKRQTIADMVCHTLVVEDARKELSSSITSYSVSPGVVGQ